MMATTHAFAGLAIVAPVAAVAPEFTTPLAAGAIVGGLFPDLDLVVDHRRTLHFPLLYGFLAIPAILVAGFVSSPVTVAVAAFVVAAWVHAASDILGGSTEMDPWSSASDRGVYDHFRGRWLAPRRVIRYDGSPEDVVLAIALAIPVLLVFTDVGWVRAVVVGGLAVSVVYALLRRRLVEWAGILE